MRARPGQTRPRAQGPVFVRPSAARSECPLKKRQLRWLMVFELQIKEKQSHSPTKGLQSMSHSAPERALAMCVPLKWIVIRPRTHCCTQKTPPTPISVRISRPGRGSSGSCGPSQQLRVDPRLLGKQSWCLGVTHNDRQTHNRTVWVPCARPSPQLLWNPSLQTQTDPSEHLVRVSVRRCCVHCGLSVGRGRPS